MIYKYVVVLLSIFTVGPASAQLGNLFGTQNGPRATPPTESSIVANAWASVSPEQMACLRAALHKAGRPDVQELISRGISPSAPSISNHLLICKSNRKEAASAVKTIVPFVRWLDAEVAVNPALTRAFNQCAAMLSAYQNQLLIGLRAQAAASRSRSQQDALHSTIERLSVDQAKSVRAGCIKSFLANLNVAGSSGSYGDELSLLGGRLTQSNFELTARVQTRYNDLTDQGMKQFLAALSFENIRANDLRAEIEMAATRPNGSDYLACFLMSDWVSWFSSNSSCHKPLLEKSLISAVESVTVQVR